MVKAFPCAQVYLASASPPVRYPNVYGVDMPVRSEFVASDKTEDEICKELGADRLIYQSLQDLVAVGHDLNPEITEFDTSCFTGVPWPTEDETCCPDTQHAYRAFLLQQGIEIPEVPSLKPSCSVMEAGMRLQPSLMM